MIADVTAVQTAHFLGVLHGLGIPVLRLARGPKRAAVDGSSYGSRQGHYDKDLLGWNDEGSGSVTGREWRPCAPEGGADQVSAAASSNWRWAQGRPQAGMAEGPLDVLRIDAVRQHDRCRLWNAIRGRNSGQCALSMAVTRAAVLTPGAPSPASPTSPRLSPPLRSTLQR